jgi:DNA-binding NtrC family response regulator
LTKPFEGDELVICVKRAIEHRRVLRENAVLKASREPVQSDKRLTGLERVIGRSGTIERVRGQLGAIALSHGTVLITGESGTGKEVVSRAIHEMSGRRSGAFLAINCAALSESLLESELFGHERGAFTGAEKMRKGRFELADGGTLLLDEISEISPKIQAKLLRVLQERSFERVGSSTAIGVDVRIVATSNRELPMEVEKGNFRQDLYFRLNVLPVHLPPLRERREDVVELATHFIAGICAREGRPMLALTAEAVGTLTEYHWPGNVRELQNICERAVVLTGSSGAAISRELLEPWLRIKATPMLPQAQIESKTVASPETAEAIRTLEEIERETIVRTLERFRGHRQRTATALGIGVRTLGLKLKKWKEMGLVDVGI